VQYIYSTNLVAGQTYELDVTNAQYMVPTLETYGLAWSIAFVPEPTTAALMGLGLLLAARRPRHRRV
jgi:hypothetical protein